MANQDLNRRFAELVYVCAECEKTNYCDLRFPCRKDFAADPRLVLREMMKRPDYERFFSSIMPIMHIQGVLHWVEIYLLDTTSLLRDKAIEWLEMEAKP